MTGIKKSTDAGLSNAERKDLRGREAKEAPPITKTLSGPIWKTLNACGRLAREAAEGPMLYPAPEIPDDTRIKNVRFSTRVRYALTTAGVKTVGEIREALDATLLSLLYLGKGSVAHLRETSGLQSTDGVRPLGKKLT